MIILGCLNLFVFTSWDHMPSKNYTILVLEFSRHKPSFKIVVPWEIHLDSIRFLKDLPHVTAPLRRLVVFRNSSAQWCSEQAVLHSFGFQNVGHWSKHAAFFTLLGVFYQLLDSAKFLIFDFFLFKVAGLMNGGVGGWCFKVFIIVGAAG